MSEQGERTCPLCAEEMDLTDQQLKPCRCGYEMCVWCWHHIIDMAEKDETEGRCPACRAPYDKERIVGMTGNCERLMTDFNTEKKSKSQKAKSKTAEGRKQLSSLRVIQRNLVYIVGLPLNLAEEDLLQRKEFFGQYGKVLKVSISRTSGGSVQHFQNNTCSVYITYSKEDEAVRCIQAVHGFILEGRSLRACFGTTKYCHSWLRNMSCSNPDCLYLHEIGPQEDSFSKDEVISAYTRNRVQQMTNVSSSPQRRSGSSLPPSPAAVDESTSSRNPSVKSSHPNGCLTTKQAAAAALPSTALWGTRASNCSSSTAGRGMSVYSEPCSDVAETKSMADQWKCNGEQRAVDAVSVSVSSVRDAGEDSIISDILSLDFDSPSLASLLRDDETRAGSSMQSRFSFAREDNPAEVHWTPVRNIGMRAKLLTPPGFSIPNRVSPPPLPPGFYGRNDGSGGDAGIMDPAILAIGKESVFGDVGLSPFSRHSMGDLCVQPRPSMAALLSGSSNGVWDPWNNASAVGVDRLGFHGLYSRLEDSTFPFTKSSHL